MPTLAQLPPPDLSPMQMFLSADPIVKAVMGLLVLASVITWTILLAKSLELAVARRRLAGTLRTALAAATLDELTDRLPSANPMLEAALAERRLSLTLPAEGVRDRVALRLHRIEAATARRLGRGVGMLASIGACGPFVGLFGTVWGIMNAFVGISKAQTTNLAVVAPGIAEALLATAAGLVAAIPAVLIYNLFTRTIAARRAELGDLSAAILVLLSRDLDRAEMPAPRRLRAAAE
jgi:biopolymer transport protein ExbB